MVTDEAIRLVIAEDHSVLRQRYIEILEPFNIITVGEAGNGEEALEALKKHEPDILLLDLNMPVMNGSITMDKIIGAFSEVKIIVLSFYDSDLIIDDYIARGAKGFIPKGQADYETLPATIRRVFNGETVIVRHNTQQQGNDQGFSRRQAEIIPLICDGLTNKEIADELGLTQRAIEKQKQQLYIKTGTQNLASFLAHAIRHGLHFLHKKEGRA